jgi:hypothetical protein
MIIVRVWCVVVVSSGSQKRKEAEEEAKAEAARIRAEQQRQEELKQIAARKAAVREQKRAALPAEPAVSSCLSSLLLCASALCSPHPTHATPSPPVFSLRRRACCLLCVDAGGRGQHDDSVAIARR